MQLITCYVTINHIVMHCSCSLYISVLFALNNNISILLDQIIQCWPHVYSPQQSVIGVEDKTDCLLYARVFKI